MGTADFHGMSFYQIWIRSFCDGNGDGIGDLTGVYSRLEYIRDLGVDGIWFSPIYPSPNADYGYDISDYKNIHPDYGTLEDFRKVLGKAHSMGLKVLMDLVINHTSDEHPWFRESRKSKDNPYSDYYIWRDPRWMDKTPLPPNNWYSQFEGLAWEYCPERQQYYLHVFARKQPDLNMANPKVREEVKSVMRFWLEMGVDGFREDVIMYISKHESLPDGLPFLPQINGLPYYNEGPRLMEYLREFRDTAAEYDALQIGEAPMTSVKNAMRYISGPNPVLDMVIHFDHMSADCFVTEYLHHPFSLRKLKRAFSRWQYALEGKAWNALYLENHDHPRIISRYGSEQFRRESGCCLAAAYLFQKGCPFLYQGQELGMTNIRLPEISSYLDVSSINNYAHFFTWQSKEKRMHKIHVSSRDSARTPMQWTDGPNAGFSDAVPWFTVNPNYPEINAQREANQPDSILNFYRKALKLRKAEQALLDGVYREHRPLSGKLYLYSRTLGKEQLLVICLFSDKPCRLHLPKEFRGREAKLLLSNYPAPKDPSQLRPWETRILKFR